VREILSRAATLPETPRIGRRVPELDDPDMREVPAHSWRVINQLRGTTVFIVTLVHRRRAPAPGDLRR
jgi:toxin ParE1/3/4